MTRFVTRCWLGSCLPAAANCITALRGICSRKTPGEFSTWPTISTPPAITRRHCLMPCRRRSRPGPNTPWKSPNKQYRIAQRGAGSAEKTIRYGIAEGLGDVLMLRGDYDAAGELFETALALAEGTFAGRRSRKTRRVGLQARRHGGGPPSPSSRPCGCWARPCHRRLPSSFHAPLGSGGPGRSTPWLPRRFIRRRQRQPSKVELLRLHLLSRLACAYWYTRGRMLDFCVHLRSMNLAERYVPTLEMAQIYSEHAVAMTLVGWYDRGLAYAKKSLEIRKSLGDLVGPGTVAEFRRLRALCGLAVYRVHREVPRGGAIVGAHRRLLGTAHRLLPDRRLALPSGRPAGRRGSGPAHAQVGGGVGRRAGIWHQHGRLVAGQRRQGARGNPSSKRSVASEPTLRPRPRSCWPKGSNSRPPASTRRPWPCLGRRWRRESDWGC